MLSCRDSDDIGKDEMDKMEKEMLEAQKAKVSIAE